MERRTDSRAEAIDFAVNHQRHTGHDPSWERSELVDGVVTVPERTRWKVRCDRCETERLFETRETAEEFTDDHRTYAGHTPTAVEEISLPELSEIGPDDFERVLDYCFEHSGSTEAIPVDAILTAFEEAGLSRKRASQELRRVETATDVVDVGGGLVVR